MATLLAVVIDGDGDDDGVSNGEDGMVGEWRIRSRDGRMLKVQTGLTVEFLF